MDRVGSISDDESSYSDYSLTLSNIPQNVRPTLKVNHPKICHIWNNLYPDDQIQWSKRALKLNKMPKLGYFSTIPLNLVNEFNQIDINSFLECISKDWLRFVNKRKRAITKKPPKEESQTSYIFLGELVKVGTQAYRSFSVSEILLRVIFGAKFSNPLIEDFIVYKSKNRIFMYFASHRVLKSVFDFNGVSAVNYKYKI